MQKTDKIITFCLDWLQYSVAWPDHVKEWPEAPQLATAIMKTAVPHLPVQGLPPMRESGRKLFGMQGYSQTFDLLFATGHVNPDRRDMKLGVRMGGNDLNCWRELGGKDTRLIEFVRGAKASTSRVDIAFDLFGYGINPLRIYEDWKAGKVNGAFRKAKPYIAGEKLPDGTISESSTCYMGSRTSEVMLRIYEKGKEQGNDLDWQRVEIEIKGDKAKAALADMYAHGIGPVGAQMLREFVDMPYRFYRDILKQKVVELTLTERKQTDRQAWLSNVIMPLLAEEMSNAWGHDGAMLLQAELEQLVRGAWKSRADKLREEYAYTIKPIVR